MKKIKRIFRSFIFLKRIFLSSNFLFSLFLFFSFFSFFSLLNKAGRLGEKFFSISKEIFGPGTYFLPLLFLFSALCFIFSPFRWKKLYTILVFLFSLFCLVGLFGKIFPFSFFKEYLGEIFTRILFFFLFLFSIFLYLFVLFGRERITERGEALIKKITIPTFKEREVPPSKKILKLEIQEKEEIEKEIFKVEYQPPPLQILEKERGRPSPGDIKENCLIIKKTLENFGIEVEMGEVFVGPTVTQYTLRPAEGIKLSKITSLANDLALALASHPIRIEAPIPGKSLVGIEVPNKVRTVVRLRELISSDQFQKNPSPLCFVLGKDVAGNPQLADLSKMPHLLVAGATGTGKTIFLNSLILSLVFKNSPKILKLLLVDPKRVEFPLYQDLPHLICPVIFDLERVVRVLDWLVFEMERRFEILAREKTRDIFSFNQLAIENKKDLMPFLVLIIDELADIMVAKGREVEIRIVRLAQLARAVGIHLVLATQRPSVEVLTGLIKANVTSRIAFQVASQFDSRTILDVAGAEKLLGKGDMLFLGPGQTKPRRIQGAFVSEKEIKKCVNYFKEKKMKPDFDPELLESLEREEEKIEFFVEKDPLFEKAKEVVVRERKASASFLQRRLKIGYARAARLLDLLEKEGIVGPSKGAKPRDILIKEES